MAVNGLSFYFLIKRKIRVESTENIEDTEEQLRETIKLKGWIKFLGLFFLMSILIFLLDLFMAKNPALVFQHPLKPIRHALPISLIVTIISYFTGSINSPPSKKKK